MKHSTRIRLSILSSFCCLLLIVSGCKSDEATQVNVPPSKAPSNFTATRLDDTSAIFRWKRADADTGRDTVKLTGHYIDSVLTFTIKAPADSLVVRHRYLIGGGVDAELSAGDTAIKLTYETAKPAAPLLIIYQFVNDGEITAYWHRASNDYYFDTVRFVNEIGDKVTRAVAYPDSIFTLRSSFIGLQGTLSVRGRGGFTEEHVAQVPKDPKPRSIMASSKDEHSVGVRWQRGYNDFNFDTVIVRDGAKVVFANPTLGEYQVVSGLELGKVYTFSVSNNGGSVSMEWSPAIRSQKIRLWETADVTTGHLSGLILDDGPTHKARAASMNASSPDRQNIDIVLATDNTVSGSGLSLVAAEVTSLSGIPSGKTTRFSEASVLFGGLDSQFFANEEVLRNRVTANGNAWDLPDQTYGIMYGVLVVKTQSGNYARIEMPYQPNGKFWDEIGGHKYVDVVVSYQPMTGTGYAGRPSASSIVPNHTKTATGTVR